MDTKPRNTRPRIERLPALFHLYDSIRLQNWQVHSMCHRAVEYPVQVLNLCERNVWVPIQICVNPARFRFAELTWSWFSPRRAKRTFKRFLRGDTRPRVERGTPALFSSGEINLWRCTLCAIGCWNMLIRCWIYTVPKKRVGCTASELAQLDNLISQLDIWVCPLIGYCSIVYGWNRFLSVTET
jgi:hypothetical protein